MSSCLGKQRIQDLAAGEAAEDVAAKWRAHIEKCTEYGQAFNEYKENLKLVRVLHDESISFSSLLRAGELILPDVFSRGNDSDISKVDAAPSAETDGLPHI